MATDNNTEKEYNVTDVYELLGDQEEDAIENASEPARDKTSENAAQPKTKKKPSGALKKRRRRKLNPLLALLIFALLVFCLIKFAMSDFFNVTKIEVEGNEHYTKAQVVELSGLGTGSNIFTMKLGGAKEALLADPYVKNVSIKKSPRDTIELIIEERIEYAVVSYGEEFVIIDNEGMVLRIADKEPVLPMLDGLTIIEMTPGKALATEETYLLADTLELLSVVEENDIYFKKINFSPVVVKAYIYDQLYCEGTPANIKDNMKKIEQLVKELYQEGTDKGIINVSKGSYLSFDPQIDE